MYTCKVKLCLCVCVSVCLCVCVSVCLCVHACVCVSTSLLAAPMRSRCQGRNWLEDIWLNIAYLRGRGRVAGRHAL